MRNGKLHSITLADMEIPSTNAANHAVREWNGRRALQLEDGAVLLPGLAPLEGTIEVDIGVDGPAYPGIIFGVRGRSNCELVYAQPHCSGVWDALQYDPVFRSSNTWQIYHGPQYQAVADVPTGRWFTLRLAFSGHEAGAWLISGSRNLTTRKPDLFIPRLAHGDVVGKIGIWTYRPAYFAEIRFTPRVSSTWSSECDIEVPVHRPGTILQWLLEGYGAVTAEENNGTVNLHRFIDTRPEARLRRSFNLPNAGRVQIQFGFSDRLRLFVDERECFTGEWRFSGFKDRASRGYVEAGQHDVALDLDAGNHTVTVCLGCHEPFGWGFGLAALGQGLTLLPIEA